jgi:hypothetical protein
VNFLASLAFTVTSLARMPALDSDALVIRRSVTVSVYVQNLAGLAVIGIGLGRCGPCKATEAHHG